MNGLGILIILGIVMYFLFSRTGGMGCCCGHSGHGDHHREPDRLKPREFESNDDGAKIIDLKPEEYEVMSEEGENFLK